MKKSAIILLLLCIGMTSCSSPKKVTSSAESVSEMVEATTAIVTEATTTTETTITELISKPAETSVTLEAIKIKREDISDYVYEGETQTVGDDTYGYLEIPIEWEYYEPYERIGVITYADNEGNKISMYNYDLNGFGIKYKDIDELALLFDYSEVFDNAELIKYEIDSYTTYKSIYVNYEAKYCALWIFECEDGVNRSIGFRGTEDFIERSDNIIKTYHLYN